MWLKRKPHELLRWSKQLVDKARSWLPERHQQSTGQKERPAFVKPLKVGYWVIGLMLGTFFTWSVAWPLAEGTFVQGELAYTESQINLNHTQGGRVTAIHVSTGDYVSANDPLLEFDVEEVESQLQIVTDRLARLSAERLRRLSEVQLQSSIDWSRQTIVPIPERILVQEQNRFDEQRLSLTQQQQIQGSRKAQIRDSIKGLQRQLAATKDTQASVDEEIVSLVPLLKEQMVSESEVIELRRRASQIQRDVASLESQIASQKEKIQEISLDLERSKSEYKTTATERLAQLDSEIEELSTRKRDYERRIARAVIRAPADGWIDDVTVGVIGETARPSQELITFVPDHGRFVVDARLSPRDVDSVKVGQIATLEFSTFSRRNPPRLDGRLNQISASALTDPNTGQDYYRVKVEILPDQAIFAEIREDVRVGMPVQTLIQSGERTFAQYIIDPFAELTRGAFHE
jgi:HlyD family type I secretion membrane fusion protein